MDKTVSFKEKMEELNLTSQDIKGFLEALDSDDLRLYATSEICPNCGTVDPRCQCWNDE